jgi:hypothetical protein
MSNLTFIYALCDPRTLEVRYVGKADNPYKRYCRHLIDKENTHKVTVNILNGKNGNDISPG